MSQVGTRLVDQLLQDARGLLRDDRLAKNREKLEHLRKECLEDPAKLYVPEKFAPRFVVWELTLRCNMRCAHCGSAAGGLRGDELNLEEMLDLADQLGALRCERLTLLGGEPLLHEHWEKITKRLQDAGVRVNVITNGWQTADRALVQRIKDAGLTTFAISVDGNREKHDKLRKREGSFDRILQSYDHANEIGGLSLAAVTTITKLVMDDLEDLYKIFVDKGVKIWQLQLCTPQGRMEHDDPILPDSADLIRLADFIAAKTTEGKMRIDPADNIGYYGTWELEEGIRTTPKGRESFWSGCRAGCDVAGIMANGDILGCLSLPAEPRFIEGNIRTESLETIWRRPGGFAYNREFSLDDLEGFCSTCDYRGLCRGGCHSHVYCKTQGGRDNPDCLHRLQATMGK